MKKVTGLESQPLVTNEKANLRHESKIRMYLCCLVVLFGSLSAGTMLGISSPLIPDIQKDKGKNSPNLSSSEVSWFGGLLLIGGVFGGTLAGIIMEKMGRKATSVISAIPYLVGLAFIGFANQVWMLYVGRIISGLGVGMSCLVVPVYIGEVSTANLRGMLGSGPQLFIVTGIFLIYVLGIVLPWRWLCAAATILPFMTFFFSLFIVETPRYVMMKNGSEKAMMTLQSLRGKHADIDEEFQELKSSLSSEVKPSTWKEIITQKELRTPTLLSLGAMYFQQMSGINAVMFYAATLFQTAGFTNPVQLNIALLLVAGTQVVVTFVSCLITDRSGRRSLLVIGGVFMALSMAVFGLYFELIGKKTNLIVTTTPTSVTEFTTMLHQSTAPFHHQSSNLTWMALVSMMTFIAAYSIGFGPIAWLLVGEMIPVRARGNSAGLSTSFNILLAFIVTFLFSSMLKSFTPQGTFWFFAANSALSVFFSIFLLPETKGKSLEEIEAYFQEN